MEKEFVTLINDNRGLILKVCDLYLSTDEDKKDLFQEIVLQLWRSYPSFRQESLRTTWMYKVALNTAITSFRKTVNKPPPTPLPSDAMGIPDILHPPEENDRLALLMRAIKQLSKVERAVIMLYLEDRTYEEMSEILGITQSNIGVKLNRIRTKLENIIKSDNYESRRN